MFQSVRVALLSLVVVPVGLAAFSATAEAGTVTFHSTSGLNQYTGNNGGGEFGATAFSGLQISTSPMRMNNAGGSPTIADTFFQTFCMEGSGQHMTFDQSLNWSLSTTVNNDGTTQIAAQTAFLYTKFWNGQLTGINGFNYDTSPGSGRVSDADALQAAIWYFQGLQSVIPVGSDAEKLVNYANTAVASGGEWFGKGIGDVRVLVLTTQAGAAVQDVLILTSVPLPPAALLGLALIGGLGVAGAVRRRRQSIVS